MDRVDSIKKCNHCKQEKSTTEFHRNKSIKDGFSDRCKSCRKEDRLSRLEEYRKRRRNYYWSHLEKERAGWKRKDKQGHAVCERTRRSRIRKCPGRHTKQQIAALYESQNFLCLYCSVNLNGKFHVDHKIPISRGGSNGIENLQILCQSCNDRKSTYTAEEYERKIGYVKA